MLLDTIHGTIDRRILLNYRIDPAVLQHVLPKQFKPKMYQGYGIGGVCMIRFKGLRPRNIPSWLGINSENAAHRIAVEWNEDGIMKEGVFIPRRDTGSSFNKAFGGRAFPGIFQKSRFISEDKENYLGLKIIRNDGAVQIDFAGIISSAFSSYSVFPSIQEAANFFSLGATGYSVTRSPDHFHGMELRCLNWDIEPVEIERALSSYYDDRSVFPEGSISLDSALVMRNIAHEWHSRPDLWASKNDLGLTMKRRQ